MKRSLLAVPYLVWMVIFTVIPLAIVVYYAFTDSITGAFTLSNFGKIGIYLPVFFRSIALAAASCGICFLIGYPAALCITSAKPRTQRLLTMLVILPMSMSFLLRTLAWVAALEDTGIINRFLSRFGVGPLPMARTNGAVILGMVYNYLPYMILPLCTVLSKLDPRLREAAEDLGCNGKNVFFRVTLPLSLPGIVSGVTMVFVPAVSTFYISQKLGGTGSILIGDVIESQFKSAYNPNLGAALSLILMLMVLACVGIMNRLSGGDEAESEMEGDVMTL